MLTDVLFAGTLISCLNTVISGWAQIFRGFTHMYLCFQFSVEEMHHLEALWALHDVCFGVPSLGAADLFRRHEPDGWVQSPPSPALSCRETVPVCWWPILGPSQNGPHCAIQRALWRDANICPLYARFPQQKENTASNIYCKPAGSLSVSTFHCWSSVAPRAELMCMYSGMQNLWKCE